MHSRNSAPLPFAAPLPAPRSFSPSARALTPKYGATPYTIAGAVVGTVPVSANADYDNGAPLRCMRPEGAVSVRLVA